MKKLMVTVLSASAMCLSAMADDETPVLWGFGNTGIYSGYQLYGSLLNSEPTWQTYAEVNGNLLVKDLDLGYLGVGIWINSDLTKKRHDSYERFFNEQDFNLHWGKTFWFDDDRTWGLDYRTSFVWYYYPHHAYKGHDNYTPTTMDWNHYFELKNPFVTPYLNCVHEYHESDGNLLQFGLKKDVSACDALTITPGIEFVWRNGNYNWCFPKYGYRANSWTSHCGSGLATMKIGLDANYRLCDNFGIFAKVAYCQTLDKDLRDSAEAASGADYGKYKDFAWGGIGVTWNF